MSEDLNNCDVIPSHVKDINCQMPVTIVGGRAMWVVRAGLAVTTGLICLIATSAALCNGHVIASMVSIPAIVLLSHGFVIEIAKAHMPNFIVADRNGIELRQADTVRHFTWDDYLGVAGSAWTYKNVFFVMKVRKVGGRGWRTVVIGPFPPTLASTLRDCAAQMGQNVPLQANVFSD